MLFRALIFSFIFFLPCTLVADKLSKAALQTHPLFSSAHWGIYLIDAQTKKVLLAHQADHLFLPASLTKLFTTVAALETLGVDYVFNTYVEASSHPDQEGVINGNLYLVGGADPSLATEDLYDLARRVHAQGVRTIEGQLIVDNSLFKTTWPLHAEWEDLTYAYAAEENALSINDNSVVATIYPHPDGEVLAQIEVTQELPYCELLNQVETIPIGAESRITISREFETNRFLIAGGIPAESTPKKISIALPAVHEYARQIFLKALTEQGICFENKDLERAERSEIARISSAALPIILTKLNKVSHNLTGNLIYKMLQRVNEEPFAALLQRLLIPSEACLLLDGAGLSRHNSVTPKQVVSLLDYAYEMDEFLNTLPIAGGDGTLVTRFRELPKGFQMKAKTGSMVGTCNLAGYIVTPRGRELIFALFINHSLWPAQETAQALDTLLIKLMKKGILDGL